MDDEGAEVAALVRQAASGDQAAYDALVGRFGALVWHIARAHRLNNEDAADVSQTVWLRFVEQLDRLREPSRAGAWLATTARRECLAVIRRAGRVVPVDLVSLDHQGVSQLPPVVAVDAEQLEARDRVAAVRSAFADLSDQCQALLRLLSADPPVAYDHISAALAMPVGSIGPTRQRCLRRLADHPALVGINERTGDSSGDKG